MHSGACIDAVTGLGTPAVLRLRLKEIYQHCRAFGFAPNEAYCFVVVDAATDDLAPFERDAVMITTAGVIGDIFHSGETLIRYRSRLIVLASKSDTTRRSTAALIEALRDAPDDPFGRCGRVERRSPDIDGRARSPAARTGRLNLPSCAPTP